VGKRGYGTKEGESGTGRVWAAGFHHVTARSGLARVFETYESFIYVVKCASIPRFFVIACAAL
jgi:hypothetical protein